MKNRNGATYDYVIVGAGSAGALLASRLSEDGGSTMCLLEAGPADDSIFIGIPAGFLKVIFDPGLTWSFETERGPAIGNRKLPALQGRVVGGSGSINGMVYVRGQARDFDTWAQLGNRGWSYDDVLPYFRELEHRAGVCDPNYRGQGGKLSIVDLSWKNKLVDSFIASAETVGIPRNPDYNGARQDGVGPYQYNIDRGWRHSSARAFLRPALRRGNIDLRTNAMVERILFEGRAATGVRYRNGGGAQDVFARREVILCGGALNTPRLLQVSGVGAADHLGSIGVPVVHELRGVGANLRDHYTPRMVLRAQDTLTINDVARCPRVIGEGVRWLLNRPSIIGMGVVLGAAFWKSSPELDAPDMVITFTPGSFKAGFLGVLDDVPGMTVGTWQLRPESHGHVRARSMEMKTPPEIQPNYLTAAHDRDVVVKGLKLIRKILAQPAMARYCAEEMLPGRSVQSDSELLSYAMSQGLGGYHYCGTCRMAPESDPDAVVDDALRVRGLDRLRVVDASIMPNIVSGNTNATTMMIAEKGADLIRKGTP